MTANDVSKSIAIVPYVSGRRSDWTMGKPLDVTGLDAWEDVAGLVEDRQAPGLRPWPVGRRRRPKHYNKFGCRRTACCGGPIDQNGLHVHRRRLQRVTSPRLLLEHLGFSADGAAWKAVNMATAGARDPGRRRYGFRGGFRVSCFSAGTRGGMRTRRPPGRPRVVSQDGGAWTRDALSQLWSAVRLSGRRQAHQRNHALLGIGTIWDKVERAGRGTSTDRPGLDGRSGPASVNTICSRTGAYGLLSPTRKTAR